MILAQGSSTVAMLTTAGMMTPLIDNLNVHPVYLMMEIGSGSVTFLWYNSSPFWIISEIGGLNQSETYKTYTAVGLIISVVGSIVISVAAFIFSLV